MERKKRRLFNGFDLAVALVVLLGAFVWFFVINRAPEVEEETFAGTRAAYFIETINLTQEQIATVQIGDRLLEGSRHVPIGYVAGIEVRPHLVRIDDDETQTIDWQVSPERYAMILRVETEVVETHNAILAEGAFAIRGGSPINFTGPGFAFTDSFVLGWERGE